MQRSDRAVSSPCTKICIVDPTTGWCRGCLRTLDEIARWPHADDAERRAILGHVLNRRRSRE